MSSLPYSQMYNQKATCNNNNIALTELIMCVTSGDVLSCKLVEMNVYIFRLCTQIRQSG